MTDKELLEAAAKAAGFTRFQYCETSGDEPHLYVMEPPLGMWSALADDGDCFRLAVSRGLSVDFDHCAAVLVEEGDTCIPHGVDKMSAARRAIVIAVVAAAAIGKDMP